MPEYVLPDLPYDYGALEPHISGEIMQLHHDEHHRTYVTGANTALEKLAEARENDGTWADVTRRFTTARTATAGLVVPAA